MSESSSCVSEAPSYSSDSSYYAVEWIVYGTYLLSAGWTEFGMMWLLNLVTSRRMKGLVVIVVLVVFRCVLVVWCRCVVGELVSVVVCLMMIPRLPIFSSGVSVLLSWDSAVLTVSVLRVVLTLSPSCVLLRLSGIVPTVSLCVGLCIRVCLTRED